MAKSDLYKISGHWDHYKEGMFVLGDEENDKEVLALRPMTCPFQYYCYKNTQKSYRDLPYRMSETSTLFRNFDMYYIDQNGDKQRPYVIHRTSMGCYERTLAWLIEKYAGKFPTWLCPEQVRVLPISEKFADYAEEVNKELKRNGILSTVDNRSEKIGYKIREARLQKLPYMLVVGAQEQETGKVSVRSRFAGDEGQKDLKDFISAICEEIRTKEIRQEVEE